MASYDGSAYRLMIGSTTEMGGEYVPIVGETSSTINLTCDALEVTNKASQWKQYIAGNRGATINATLYADDADEQQKKALNRLMNGQKVEVSLFKPKDFFQGNVLDVSIEYWGEGYITSIGFTCSSGAVATRDITIQLTDVVQIFTEED